MLALQDDEVERGGRKRFKASAFIDDIAGGWERQRSSNTRWAQQRCSSGCRGAAFKCVQCLWQCASDLLLLCSTLSAEVDDDEDEDDYEVRSCLQRLPCWCMFPAPASCAHPPACPLAACIRPALLHVQSGCAWCTDLSGSLPIISSSQPTGTGRRRAWRT